MQTKHFQIFITIFGLIAFVLRPGGAIAAAPTQQMPESKPVKLIVKTDAPTYTTGAKAVIEIGIQDASNKPVKAAKDYIIEIELRAFPSRQLRKKMQDTIRAGESSAKLALALEENGIFSIHAKHLAKMSELLEYDVFIRVRPMVRSLQRPRHGAWLPDFNSRFWGVGMLLSPALPQFVIAQGKELVLKSSPQRTLLADGKDAATIHLFYGSEEGVALSPIRVRLFSSSGRLEPMPPLIIPEGEDYAQATLTSNKVETITIEFLGSTPEVPVPGARQLQIKFGPPITQLGLDASPPKINLVDKSDLVVRLLNETGTTPIATDTVRQISFTIARGSGEIEQKELAIPAGRSEGRTTFLPTKLGEVEISASTPDLQPVTVLINVSPPLSLLGLSLLGGLAGGVIAYWMTAKSKWWRVAIGFITGFVFYWAIIFGLLDVLPRAIVLNPLSAFAISTLGGWLGTEVFTRVLKPFGAAV
ncbi:MAG: hypothetical protein ALAOOOJD_00033 [bacterium]|nr:hypothetical protein [bacterium]